MSEIRRTEDPSGQRYVTERLAGRYEGMIDHVEWTLLAQDTFDEALMGSLLTWMQESMLGELVFSTELSIRRGIYAAARDVNRLSPDYAPGRGWLPSDDIHREEAVKRHSDYIIGMTDETRERILNVVRQGRSDGMSWREMSFEIREAFKFTHNKADQIARTELMNCYNTATRLRYRAWGIKRYRFHAHLDCCHEPKELRDGSVVERGCEELHNQAFPVEDDIHCPPVHVMCRCTILPVIE